MLSTWVLIHSLNDFIKNNFCVPSPEKKHSLVSRLLHSSNNRMKITFGIGASHDYLKVDHASFCSLYTNLVYENPVRYI